MKRKIKTRLIIGFNVVQISEKVEASLLFISRMSMLSVVNEALKCHYLSIIAIRTV